MSNSITQDIQYKQTVVEYSYRHGVTKLCIKLQRKAGYTRSLTSLYRVMYRIGIYEKTPSKKKQYEPKPYEQIRYPRERIQVDVKYVLSLDLIFMRNRSII